jgi:anti-sigma28 factor (negative regulator of flagellin synthesis)
MQINSKHTGPLRPETTRASQPADTAETDAIRSAPPTPSSADRSDKVSISDAGRALAARQGGTETVTFDSTRLASIGDRVSSGAYNTLEVVDAVARRLLASGDL